MGSQCSYLSLPNVFSIFFCCLRMKGPHSHKSNPSSNFNAKFHFPNPQINSSLIILLPSRPKLKLKLKLSSVPPSSSTRTTQAYPKDLPSSLTEGSEGPTWIRVSDKELMRGRRKRGSVNLYGMNDVIGYG